MTWGSKKYRIFLFQKERGKGMVIYCTFTSKLISEEFENIFPENNHLQKKGRIELNNDFIFIDCITKSLDKYMVYATVYLGILKCKSCITQEIFLQHRNEKYPASIVS